MTTAGGREPTSDEGKRRAKGAILVVDDNEDTRDLIQTLLEAEGYLIRTASDGGEALDALAEITRPRLVLLDYFMPGMSGRDLIERMWADEELARVPCVVMTGAADSVDLPGVLTLLKPVDIEALVRLVRELAGPA